MIPPDRCPGIAAVFVIFDADAEVAGHRVLFQEMPSLVARVRSPNTRISTLLEPTPGMRSPFPGWK